MFGGGTTNPYDEIVVKATDENLTGENWEIILTLCDKVGDEGQDGAHNAIAAIIKRLAHRNPNVQLYALSLAESLSKNLGIELHREISSKAFTQALEKIVTDRTTHDKVRKRCLVLIAEWAAEFEKDTTLGIMEQLYDTLKAKNYKFEQVSEPLPPTVDDEIRRKEEEELQRVLEMSMHDKGGRGVWSEYSLAGGSSSGAGSSSAAHSGAGSSSAAAPTGYSAPKYQAGYVPARTPSPATQKRYRDRSPQSQAAPQRQASYAEPTPQPHTQAQPTPTAAATVTATSPTVAAATSLSGIVTRVRALHTFEPSEPGELAFEKGDIIKVVDRGYKDWWRGQLKGRTGIFPVNYVEPMPEPTATELAREAEQEAAVFSQAVNVEKLLTMLKTLDPEKDNLADDEEIQELYRSCMSLRPKIVKLIDKYSQKRADLVTMNETFVRARSIFDRMMEESLARHTGIYDQQLPYGRPPSGYPSNVPQQRQRPASVQQPYGWSPNLYDQSPSGYSSYPVGHPQHTATQAPPVASPYGGPLGGVAYQPPRVQAQPPHQAQPQVQPQVQSLPDPYSQQPQSLPDPYSQPPQILPDPYSQQPQSLPDPYSQPPQTLPDPYSQQSQGPQAPVTQPQSQQQQHNQASGVQPSTYGYNAAYGAQGPTPYPTQQQQQQQQQQQPQQAQPQQSAQQIQLQPQPQSQAPPQSQPLAYTTSQPQLPYGQALPQGQGQPDLRRVQSDPPQSSYAGIEVAQQQPAQQAPPQFGLYGPPSQASVVQQEPQLSRIQSEQVPIAQQPVQGQQQPIQQVQPLQQVQPQLQPARVPTLDQPLPNPNESPQLQKTPPPQQQQQPHGYQPQLVEAQPQGYQPQHVEPQAQSPQPQPQGQQLQGPLSPIEAQEMLAGGPPYIYDPSISYPDPNVQAWAQYYAQGGVDLAGAVYFVSVPGVTDGGVAAAAAPASAPPAAATATATATAGSPSRGGGSAAGHHQRSDSFQARQQQQQQPQQQQQHSYQIQTVAGSPTRYQLSDSGFVNNAGNQQPQPQQKLSLDDGLLPEPSFGGQLQPQPAALGGSPPIVSSTPSWVLPKKNVAKPGSGLL